MSNAIISYPDRTLSATLSGGSWQASASLANLKDQMLANVARSTNALAASSIAQVDMGATINTRVISVCAHNVSAAGTIRVRGYSDSGYTAMVTGADTGTVTVWPAGFTAQQVIDYPKHWTYCFSSLKAARYWKVEITDTGNAAGYIELGRLWIGESTFEPTVGVVQGITLGYESRDVIEESLGGIPWGDRRTPRRNLTATFKALTPTEKRQAIILQKVLTETVEALWITDQLAAADDMLLEAFPCFLSKPSPIQYPYFDRSELAVSITERL